MKISNRVRHFATGVGCVALATLSTLPTFAATGDGTNAGQTYGLGQGGGPAAADWQLAAQGFNSSLSPMLVALLPVFVVILAIWMGPGLLKKLLKTAVK